MILEENEMRQWNIPYRRATVSAFRIDKYEVSNKKYRDYTHWLEKLGKGYESLVKDALPDTTVWREDLAYNEPMVEGYFRAKAFNDYPVVGVSWVQAVVISATSCNGICLISANFLATSSINAGSFLLPL